MVVVKSLSRDRSIFGCCCFRGQKEIRQVADQKFILDAAMFNPACIPFVRFFGMPRKGSFKIIPLAEVTELSADLSRPSAAGVREQWAAVGLLRLGIHWLGTRNGCRLGHDIASQTAWWCR